MNIVWALEEGRQELDPEGRQELDPGIVLNAPYLKLQHASYYNISQKKISQGEISKILPLRNVIEKILDNKN
uniref:Uncharacterized protein n=1 Tax=Romanomermis culicivorax TaxID=13658 RepID=A0A915IGN8_ROMCU